MKEAFKKAGFDAITIELRGLILDAMKKCHDNIPRAFDAFQKMTKSNEQRTEIERYYFTNHLPSADSQSLVDAKGLNASANGAGGGQFANEHQGSVATSGAVHVRKHERRRPRSTELREFEGVLKINAVFQSRVIDGRMVGLLAWGESWKDALVTNRASGSAHFEEIQQ